MGKYLKGILGPFSGLVGTVVGASWNGVEVLRSRPKKSSKAPTTAQLKQRETFALVSDFLGELQDVINVGFQAYHKGQTPYNAAFKLNIEKAVTGVYPAIVIDYPEVELSKGNLLEVPFIAMATTEDAQLDLSWVNNADSANPDDTNGSDKLTVVAYNPARKQLAKRKGVALRSAQLYDMPVPAMWSGDEVYVWAFFVKANGKQVSNSSYVGMAEVQ